MDKFILLLFTFFIFNGCSRHEVTPTRIEVTAANFTSNLGELGEGGVYLYAYGPNGKSIGQVISGSSFSENLQNGNWTFYAVAWDGVGNGYGLSGAARCAQSSVNLDGSEVNLSLVLTKENCESATFTGGHALRSTNFGITGYPLIDTFPELEMEICNKLPSVLELNDGANPLSSCEYDLTNSDSKLNRGYFTSLKIVLPSFRKLNGAMTTLESEEDLETFCVQVNPENASVMKERGILHVDDETVTALNIPMGSVNAPFPFVVRGYYGSECEDEHPTGLKDIFLTKGRLENTAQVKPVVAISSGVSKGKLYLETPDSDICNYPRTLINPNPEDPQFSAGVGTLHVPFIICNASQFNSIANNDSHLSSHFKLMADINFSDGLFFGGVTPVGDSGAWDLTPSDFTGTFNGGSKKLSHFLINSSTTINKLGLFRRLNSAFVKNLSIDNAGMMANCDSICDSFGLLAGEAINSHLENIFVTGHVGAEGDQVIVEKVGGVVGSVNVGTLKNIFANISVSAHGDSGSLQIGGLVGLLDSSILTQSAAKGEVRAKELENVGGLVGSSSNSSTLSELHFQGRIEGFNKVGGLVGELNSSTLSHSYAFGLVEARDDNQISPAAGYGYVGGLIGTGTSTSTLSHNFFTHGDVKSYEYIASRSIYGNFAGTCTNSFGRVGPGNTSFTNGTCGDRTLDDLQSVSNFTHEGSPTVEVPVANTAGDSAKKFFVASADAYSSNSLFYDYPRLKWELNFENKIPFLKRPCSSLLAPSSAPTGSGTATDPYKVCQIEQLYGATSSWNDGTKYYKLMRDLDFDFSFPATASVGLGRAGVMGAKFDGNKKHFFNIQFQNSTSSSTGFSGLWNTILSTGQISKLNLSLVRRSFLNPGAGISITTPLQYNTGLIASENSGVIEHIKIMDASIDVSQLRFSSNIGGSDPNFEVNVGGLVGRNLGTIQHTEGNPHIEFFKPTQSSCSGSPSIDEGCLFNNLHHWDNTKIGGIAGLNQGIISNSRTWMHLYLDANTSEHSFNLGNNDYLALGALAGENLSSTVTNGIIKESTSVLTFELNQPNSSIYGNYYLGGAIGKNNGKAENIQTYSEVDFSLIAPSGDSRYAAIGGVIGKNIGLGTLSKSMSEMNPLAITMTEVTVGGLIGKNYNSTGLPSNSNLCSYQFSQFNPEKMEFASSGGTGVISDSSRCLDLETFEIVVEQDVLILSDNVDYASKTLNLEGWSFVNDFFDLSSTAIWLVDPGSNKIELRGDVGLPEN